MFRDYMHCLCVLMKVSISIIPITSLLLSCSWENGSNFQELTTEMMKEMQMHDAAVRAVMAGCYEPLELPLSEEQREELAECIVHSVSWRKVTKAEGYMLKNDLHEVYDLMPYPALWDSDDSFVERVWIPYIVRVCADPEIVAFARGKGGALLKKSGIFDFVARYYIQVHPEERDGWDFLWYFSSVSCEEADYCAVIKRVIREQRLDRFAYGKRLKSLLAPLKWRPNNGRCLN